MTVAPSHYITWGASTIVSAGGTVHDRGGHFTGWEIPVGWNNILRRACRNHRQSGEDEFAVDGHACRYRNMAIGVDTAIRSADHMSASTTS